MINFDWASVIIGLLSSLFLMIIRENIKQPKLKFSKISGPWNIQVPSPFDFPNESYNANAYRLRIENKKRLIPINSAAENCMCWINIDGKEETFQLPWFWNDGSVIINVEDYRELDFCARNIKTGQIVTPSNQSYSRPIILGDGKHSIKGCFRVTSQNGKKEERKFTIAPIKDNKLDIKIE